MQLKPPWWFCCGWWSPWCVIDETMHWVQTKMGRPTQVDQYAWEDWVCDTHDRKMIRHQLARWEQQA